jgi:hypothetical protein
MGGGSWDNTTYSANASAARAAGRSTFDYDDQIKTGKATAAANPLLDPLIKAGPASPFAGQVMREVTISDEHPNPTAVAIILDVTGSNIHAARAVHRKLPQLFGLLQRKGYAEDPQILIGAIGDAYSDKVPLQVGQFESDNRIDAMVEAMYLEGNGGGQVHETYEVGAYFLARHTHLEPWHKQGRKGYAIFIGDELPYETVRRDFGGYYGAQHTLESLTGDTLEADISTKQIFEELKEQYEVFFLFQKQGSYDESSILPAWRELLGERALVLEDPNAVCEFIAGLLAMLEGGFDLDEIEDDLKAIGADASAIKAAGKALATVGGGGGGTVAATDGSLPADTSSTGGTSRI